MNEQKAEKLFRAVSDVGDDLIEEAGTVQKRKTAASWRWGAIAACLCIALMGTAAAARFSGVWVTSGSRRDMPGFEIRGGITYYPVDSLSEDIRALDGKSAIKRFENWESVEDFIGMDLMNNPVLTVSPDSYYYRFKRSGLKGNFFVRVSESLECIDALGAYKLGNTFIDMRAFLYTERASGQEDWDELFYGVYFPDQSEIELDMETYTSPSGLVAQIVQTDSNPGDPHITAAFSINGIPFLLFLRNADTETGRDILIQVLDSFQV